MTTKHAISGSNIQRLKDAVVSLSEADVFGLARLEWDVVGRYEAPMGEGGTRCVCGHDPISECFKIRNRENGNVLEPIGNVCVRHFESFAMDSQMAALSGAARVRAASAKLPDGETLPLRKDESPDGKTPFSRHAIEGLYLLGAFGPREKNGLEINSAETACQTVLSAFNARKPDSEQLRFAHAFVEGRVRPFLAENAGTLALRVTNHL